MSETIQPDEEITITLKQLNKLKQIADGLDGYHSCMGSSTEALARMLEGGDPRNLHIRSLQYLTRRLGGEWVSLDALIGDILAANDLK